MLSLLHDKVQTRGGEGYVRGQMPTNANVICEGSLSLSAGLWRQIIIFFETLNFGPHYSRVHISSDTAFLKILKKPSIVQE